MTFFCSSDTDNIRNNTIKKLEILVKISNLQRFLSFGTYSLNCDGHFGFIFDILGNMSYRILELISISQANFSLLIKVETSKLDTYNLKLSP